MSELESRIRRLEDIEEIRRLKAAYCLACDDDHNGDAVAALFVPEGVWQSSHDRPREGHAEIASKMFGIRKAGLMARSTHMVTNPEIDVDGDEATGRWKFVMMYTTADQQGFVRIIGDYEESYVRRDGSWLFRSLMANVHERGDYTAEPTAR